MTSRFQKMAEEARSSEVDEAAKQEALAKEQEELERKAAEESFLQSLKKRDELQGALDALEESKKAFKGARNEQRKGRQSLEADRQDAILAGVENVPTVYDLLKTEEDELESNPSEEDYKNKKQEVSGAAKQLKEKIEALRSLGVDPKDKSNEELVEEVKEIKAAEDVKVREYARQNPDSELPEVIGVRQEMIQEKEKQLVDGIYHSEGVLFGGATNRALRELERNGWFRDDLSGEDSYTRDQLRKHLPKLVLQEVKKSDEYKKVLEALSADIYKQGGQFDSIDTEAFSGAVKKLLLNYKDGYRGELRPIDATRAHTTWENSIQTEGTLRKIYESFPGQSLEEFRYEDGGYKYESLPHLATLFEGEALKKFSLQTYEAASLKGRLGRWESDRTQITREYEGAKTKENELGRQKEDTQRGIESQEATLREYEKREQALRELVAGIPFVQEDFAGEQLKVRASYGELGVTFASDTESYKALQAEQSELEQAANKKITDARTALYEAKQKPRPKLFGKETYDSNLSALEAAITQAESAAEETKAKRIQAFEAHNAKERARSKDKIIELGKAVGIGSFDGSWEDFLVKVKQEAEATLTRIEESKVSSTAELTSMRERLALIQEQAEANLKIIQEKQGLLENEYSASSRQMAERRMDDLLKSSF
jgi:hypothetical protein